MSENLIGRVFGKLTVIEQGEDYIDKPSETPIPTWICKCECGNVSKPFLEPGLLAGYYTHCGCENTPNATDMIGFVSGYLTVVERAPDKTSASGKRESMWICYCSKCDRLTKPIQGSSLRKHHTRSCGCRVIESATTHGGKKERLYGVYRSMLDRCNNPNNEGYKNYGGRGIRVTDDFKNYEDFRKWAIDNGYDPDADKGETTINRIDNDGNYSMENCNFVSMKIQSNNRRSNVWITYRGTKYTLSEFADFLGMPYFIVSSRYNHGWDPERIANTPIMKDQSDRVEYNGQLYTYKQLEELCGISESVIYDRIHKFGWSVEKAVSTPVKSFLLEVDGVSAPKSTWDHVFGFGRDTISHRIADGWAVEKAVTTPQKGKPMNAIYFIDDNGNPISEEDYDKLENKGEDNNG